MIGSGFTPRLAGPAVCGVLMETRRFPLVCVPLAGSRPGSRVTSLRRQRSNQERRPRRAGRLLKRSLIRRLPCAAHNRRPAQNSRAAPAQTAAPDFPACCSAAQRFGRGFLQTPSLCWSGGGHRRVGSGPWEMDAAVAVPDLGMSGYALRANPTYAAVFDLSPFRRSHTPVLKRAVIPKSPF